MEESLPVTFDPIEVFTFYFSVAIYWPVSWLAICFCDEMTLTTHVEGGFAFIIYD